MKKARNSKFVTSTIVVLILISIGIGVIIYSNYMNTKFEPVNNPVFDTLQDMDVTSSVPEPPVKPPVAVRIIGVGDNLIHEGIYNQARKRAGGVGYDFKYAYSELATIIGDADIASINQETMLASIFAPSSYPMFNSPTELGDHMIDIGFDVFNQANNHSLDKGEKGILSTIDYWRTKTNIVTTGIYKNQEDYDKIRTITKNDIKFAFIGMTELTNGLSLPEGSPVVLMRTGDQEKIKARIEDAKSQADVVVINAHWGVEYTNIPNEFQRDLAKKMVEWGADIIFGHHPHVIQPVEYITRANGTKGIVCYSLGNFISAQNEGQRMLGGMLDVTVTKNYENKTSVISDAKFIPVVTHYGSNYSNIKNYPLSRYTKELAGSHGVLKETPEFSLNYLNEIVNNIIDDDFLT